MSWSRFIPIILASAYLLACNVVGSDKDGTGSDAYQGIKRVSYNGVTVDVVIDKPEGVEMDVMLTYHGTVVRDANILQAAQNMLEVFKKLLTRTDVMIVSVAYPEENLLMGDNVAHSEAALLWVKNHAEQELGIKLKKVFLGGHSQGGYIVTRLNTMHRTDGVVANAPGPLNLVYRCQLEERGDIAASVACNLLRSAYGTTDNNPTAYDQRSLLSFTSDHLSDILFVQGMNDSPIQMYSWPLFKQQLNTCSTCKSIQFFEVNPGGHSALFDNADAKAIFNQFLNRN